jgi:NAD(P)-dependent dehydrogenase (short-subunit alcohol dehydrogenase family)
MSTAAGLVVESRRRLDDNHRHQRCSRADDLTTAFVHDLARSFTSTKLALLDIAAERGKETAELVRAEGRRAEFFHADASQRESLEAAIDSAWELLGPIDFCCANAGVATIAPLLEMEPSDVDWLMKVHRLGEQRCDPTGLSPSRIRYLWHHQTWCPPHRRHLAIRTRGRRNRGLGVAPGRQHSNLTHQCWISITPLDRPLGLMLPRESPSRGFAQAAS